MEALPLRAGGEMDSMIDRYQNMVYGLALARTGNRADADDVFQEVFLACYQSGKTFRDEEHRVWEALQGLSEDYRLPIYLFYFQELSTREIAKVLAIRPGAVRMRLTRGREQLREKLKGEFFDE